MNKVILFGNLVADPELRFAPNTGTAVTSFRIAVNEGTKEKPHTEFISLTAFGKRAETIAQYFGKGSPILIEGRLANSKYTDKNGIERYVTNVIVNSFYFTGSAKVNRQSSNSMNQDPFGDMNFDDMTPVDDGDMPF